MDMTLTLYEDNYYRKTAVFEGDRVIFELVGKHKDGTLMPMQYVSVNFKDLERVYKEAKAHL
jgi:hypothetical protein